MAVYPERRKGKLSGAWIAEVVHLGERRRKRFPTMHEAQRWADITKVTGAPPPGEEATTPKGHTLGSVMREALQNHPGWQRARDPMREPRLMYALDLLGADTPIDKLAATDLDKLVTSLKKRPGAKGGKMSLGTINRYMAGVSTLLEYARKRGYTEKAIYVPWQQEAGKRVHWLTDDQEAAICGALLAKGLKDEALTVRVLCATGMRWGELETLTQGQVTTDWVKLDATKTDTPRDIPLTPELATELREMVAQKRVPVYEPMRKKFKAAVKSAGQSPELSLHCLRHTTATRLVLGEVNLAVVQRFMGHANIKTTLKYTHVTQQSLQDAMKKISPRAGQTAVSGS